MSVLQYPDSISAPELQIWNNATFENGESEESATAVKSSWSLLQFVNRSDSIESDISKENLSPPVVVQTPGPVKPSVPLKPLNPNGAIGISQGKPLKLLPKKALFEPVSVSKNGKEELGVRDERKIDSEIEEIENEISRLSSKLEALRIEKIERTVKTVERKGRIVSAKFMEQKPNSKNSEPPSAKSKLSRRGFSLGPAEIAAAGARSRQTGKPEITPVQPIQNRRKSCFWKLQEIDETKVTKQRGQSLSLSPKSRRTVSKIQPPKQAATTVGSRKLSKKDDGVLAAIQPKKLFRDAGEKSVTAKKPARTGRVVPSRYNQTQSNRSSVASERKRSLPEDGNEDVKRCDKRRASLVPACQNPVSELRVKKKWEIPSDIVVYKSDDDNVITVSPPCVVAKVVEVLPRIRTNRCFNDSPRDSGAAKRVAELIGRRSVFSVEEEAASVCQALSFADDPEEE